MNGQSNAAKTLVKVGNDSKHGDLYQSPEAIQFEATIAAFNGVPVQPSEGNPAPASNVNGVAILLPAGTANWGIQTVQFTLSFLNTMTFIKIQLSKLSNNFERAYPAVRNYIGLNDTNETRQVLAPFLAVTTCVTIYYMLVVVSKLLMLVSQASETAIAIINI